ncbi:hypothetical protein KA478_02795 [Patescibacteria group bacterium]|nr:hypothetical protein [Patescibacteria group bacterium]
MAAMPYLVRCEVHMKMEDEITPLLMLAHLHYVHRITNGVQMTKTLVAGVVRCLPA